MLKLTQQVGGGVSRTLVWPAQAHLLPNRVVGGGAVGTDAWLPRSAALWLCHQRQPHYPCSDLISLMRKGRSFEF